MVADGIDVDKSKFIDRTVSQYWGAAAGVRVVPVAYYRSMCVPLSK
jgi:hypothetical protein